MRPVHRPVLAVAFALVLALPFAGCGDDDGAVPTIDGGPGTPDANLTPDAWTECPDPPPAQCDYFLSCGCDTMMGEKCTIVGNPPMGPVCAPSGANEAGQVCTQDSDCAAGTVCVAYGGGLRCMRFCDAGHPCPEDQSCFIRVVDDMSTELGRVCGQVCSLIGQDCQFEGQGCYPSATFAPEKETGICVNAGTKVQGEACTKANDCAEGFTCVDVSGGGSICARLCDRNDGDPGCEMGQSCSALTGHTQAGVCR